MLFPLICRGEKDTVNYPIPYAGITRIRFEGSLPIQNGRLSGFSASPRVSLSIG